MPQSEPLGPSHWGRQGGLRPNLLGDVDDAAVGAFGAQPLGRQGGLRPNLLGRAASYIYPLLWVRTCSDEKIISLVAITDDFNYIALNDFKQ